jgi:hypothetical protein
VSIYLRLAQLIQSILRAFSQLTVMIAVDTFTFNLLSQNKTWSPARQGGVHCFKKSSLRIFRRGLSCSSGNIHSSDHSKNNYQVSSLRCRCRFRLSTKYSSQPQEPGLLLLRSLPPRALSPRPLMPRPLPARSLQLRPLPPKSLTLSQPNGGETSNTFLWLRGSIL